VRETRSASCRSVLRYVRGAKRCAPRRAHTSAKASTLTLVGISNLLGTLRHVGSQQQPQEQPKPATYFANFPKVLAGLVLETRTSPRRFD
jgi:LSD1 subclass zinc finger protein